MNKKKYESISSELILKLMRGIKIELLDYRFKMVELFKMHGFKIMMYFF
jgi:hypothetical protein